MIKTDNTQEKNNKKKLILLLLLLLLISITSCSCFMLRRDNTSNNKTDKNINIGDIKGLTQEEMQDILNAKVPYNMININMNTSITIQGKDILNLDLKNYSNKFEGYKYSTDDGDGYIAVSCKDDEEKTCTKYDGKVVKVKDFKKLSITKSLAVKITVDGETNPLYESGLVPYGSYLKIGECNYKLPKGEHNAEALVTSYDENGDFLGQSIVKVILYQVE